jgi:hypothetical protein
MCEKYMSIKTIIIACTLLISIPLLTSCSTFNTYKVAVFPPSWMNLIQIDKDIYVEKEMNENLREKLLIQAEESKKYVIEVWGEIKSNPTIYACATKKCAESLGLIAPAHCVSSYLILQPKAFTKFIISHETSHAEVVKRSGGFLKWKKIPQWFDEGLAVVVGPDPRHNTIAWEKIVKEQLPHPSKKELMSIHSIREWNKATGKYNENLDYDSIVVTYATAGHYVGEWYSKAGKNGLLQLFERIKNGYSFEKSYKEAIETTSLTN